MNGHTLVTGGTLSPMKDDGKVGGGSPGPSPVLHVRGLPPFCSEAELLAVVGGYGQVVRLMVLPEKLQGFVQFPSAEVAAAVLKAATRTQPHIRMKPVFFQFSTRQSVEVRSQRHQPRARAEGAPAPAEGAFHTPPMPMEDASGCILLISVSNMSVPVTLDNIHTVCKPHGDVLKIITFPKGTVALQALVQMATPEAAANAKMFLDGKNLFQGCCHLRVDFSNRDHLIVKHNDHKSRDLTMANPLQFSGVGLMPQAPGLMLQAPGLVPVPQAPGLMPQTQVGFGGVQPGLTFGGLRAGANGAPQIGLQNGHQAPLQGGLPGAGSCVVLVNKIAENTTPDVIFTLFGVYGNVLRVKVLYNKRDTALVQYQTPEQARFAVANLNDCPLMGSRLMVQLSRHSEVKVPRAEEVHTEGTTRDYTNSSAHRYNHGQVNIKNINAPSQVLHVSNIHESANESVLRELFSTQQDGVAPVVEFFKSSRNMAFVAMASIEHAVAALITLHLYNVGPYPLRISFSHKTPNQIRNSDSPGFAEGEPLAD